METAWETPFGAAVTVCVMLDAARDTTFGAAAAVDAAWDTTFGAAAAVDAACDTTFGAAAFAAPVALVTAWDTAGSVALEAVPAVACRSDATLPVSAFVPLTASVPWPTAEAAPSGRPLTGAAGPAPAETVRVIAPAVAPVASVTGAAADVFTTPPTGVDPAWRGDGTDDTAPVTECARALTDAPQPAPGTRAVRPVERLGTRATIALDAECPLAGEVDDPPGATDRDGAPVEVRACAADCEPESGRTNAAGTTEGAELTL